MSYVDYLDKIDEMLHDYAKIIIPVFIFLAALVFLGLGYFATHPIPSLEQNNTNAGQEKVEK
ncbi:MAG: hypothetical protein Q7S05_00225 [bacterium]|nr:hypothetical protein [bacterium]